VYVSKFYTLYHSIFRSCQRMKSSYIKKITPFRVNSPHKARNLLWRICIGCAPTRLRLRSRHVQCEVTCPWCDTAVEDDWHAFVSCTVARESWYWAGLSTVLQTRVGTERSLTYFVFDICCSENRDIAGRMTLLL